VQGDPVLVATGQKERNMKQTLIVTLCLLLLVGAGELSAQNSHIREGFWIGFGLGGASLSGGCDDVGSTAGFCDAVGERQGTFAGYLMMGGTLSPHLRLGGEAYTLVGLRDFALGTPSGENTVTFANNLALTLYYYPIVQNGLFLKGGAGTSWYVEAESSDLDWEVWGLGFLLGVGYDLRIGRTLSLTPSFTFGWGGAGDLKSQGATVGENWRQTYFSLALGLTFH
jgi:hypothetical protein